MITLGIDPGTTRIGFGVIESHNNKFKVLDYGVIGNPGQEKLANYKSAYDSLLGVISKHKPDRAAVEKLFFFKNQKTVLGVSEMRGIIMLSLVQNSIPVFEFTPLEIKQSISSYGRADKDQVQRMVRLILSINEEIKPDDAADALAIAICGANNIIY